MMTLNNLQNILKRIGEMKCELCPRRCSVNRAINHGYCKQGLEAKVANYSLHFGEEPCISYKKGSGTVFFSGCSLRCVYCQNYDISNKNIGQIVNVNQLAEIFKELDENADNINLVTPTHFSNVIQDAIKLIVIFGCFSLKYFKTFLLSSRLFGRSRCLTITPCNIFPFS